MNITLCGGTRICHAPAMAHFQQVLTHNLSRRALETKITHKYAIKQTSHRHCTVFPPGEPDHSTRLINLQGERLTIAASANSGVRMSSHDNMLVGGHLDEVAAFDGSGLIIETMNDIVVGVRESEALIRMV